LKIFCEGDGDLLRFAVAELQRFFKECAGVDLEETAAMAEKCIWIGEATAAKKYGVALPEDVNGAGFVIQTQDNTCYICGASAYGALYGVYELLNVYFDFEGLTDDAAYYQKRAAADFLELRVCDAPDVEWRIVNYGMLEKMSPKSEAYAPFRRLRLNHFDDALMKPGGYFCHNYCVVIKPEEYKEKHPLWFSEGRFAGEQLCFSRDFEGLKAEVVKKLKEVIVAHPGVGVLNFSQTDSAGWCECESCRKEKEKYGTDSAIAIKFLNACVREINPWLEKEQNGRKVTFSMFAYQSTEEAPVKTVDGKYEPIDESVVMEDNVTIFYAPCTADYYRDFYDEANAPYRETMKKWHVISKQIHFWTYDLW
jgi:hypothetical protein